MERCNKPLGGKGHPSLDKTKMEKLLAKENRPATAPFQTYRDSWSGENTERRNKALVLFLRMTGALGVRLSLRSLKVIAYNPSAPFQDVTNNRKEG